MKLMQKEIESLKIMARAYYTYQDERIRITNQMGLKKDGSLKKGTPERDEEMLYFLGFRLDELKVMEKQIEKDIFEKIKTHPVWVNFLQDVKGIGPIMAAVILTEFDIEKSKAVSNMWSFAGLAPGKDKKKIGEKCPYNQFLKAKLCGVLGGSFLKSESHYAQHYYNEKTRLENSDKIITETLRHVDRKKKKHKGKTERTVAWKDAYPNHRHKAAIRKMIKMFLLDLYIAWRTIEKLPVREPYKEEYLGKKHAA